MKINFRTSLIVLFATVALFFPLAAKAQLEEGPEPQPLPKVYVPFAAKDLRNWFTAAELTAAMTEVAEFMAETGEEAPMAPPECETAGEGYSMCIQPITTKMAAMYTYNGTRIIVAILSATLFEDGSGRITGAAISFCMAGWPCDNGGGGGIKRH